MVCVWLYECKSGGEMLRGDDFREALAGVLVGEADVGAEGADLAGRGVLLALEGDESFHEGLLLGGGDVLAARDVSAEHGLLGRPSVPADDVDDVLVKPAIVEEEGLAISMLEVENDFGLYGAAFILAKTKVSLLLGALELIEIEEATRGGRRALGKERETVRGDDICERGLLVSYLVSSPLRGHVALLLKERHCRRGTLLEKERVR